MEGSRAARAWGIAGATFVLACALPPPPEPPTPGIDAEREVLLLKAQTPIEHPVRIVFDWSSNDRGARAGGRGVARVEPPDRIRLDLFLENGELAVKAALIGRELRLPPGAPDDILPPPDFLWGALGVFRPAIGSTLLGGRVLEDGAMRFDYRLDDREGIAFRFAGDELLEVELTEAGHVVQRVEIEHDGESYPARARYRNLAEFRELRIERDQVERVEGFPPDIWRPVTMRIGAPSDDEFRSERRGRASLPSSGPPHPRPRPE